jgi:PPP family 3-phenylpropionic acid transporter
MDRQILTLRGLNFWYYGTSAVLLPFLPLYLETKGYTSSQIGFFMMIGPCVAILAQPLWGYLSDRFHTVKKVILLLWSLTVLSSVGLFVTGGYTLTLLFVLLMYFFMQPSVPLLDSITIKSVSKRGISYGSVRLWGSIGFTAVTLVAGTLLNALGGVSRIPYLYWIIWIVPLALLFYLKDEPSNGERITLQTLSFIGKNKAFLWFLAMVFVISVPHRMNDVMLGLYMKQLGATDSMIGWAWSLAAVVEIPAFALLNRYLARVHEYSLIGVAAALFSIRWLFYYASTDPWELLVLQAGAAVTFAVFWISAVHYTVRVMPEQVGSTGQSLLAMVFLGLAGITGGVVGGWLNDHFGGPAMYAFSSMVSLIASVLFFLTQLLSRRQPKMKRAPWVT